MPRATLKALPSTAFGCAASPTCDWGALGEKIGWLNPPFGTVQPWAAKCAAPERLKILLLAAVGTNWWARHIDGVADRVLFVRPRLSFDGKNPFPKDVALIVYNDARSAGETIYECWSRPMIPPKTF